MGKMFRLVGRYADSSTTYYWNSHQWVDRPEDAILLRSHEIQREINIQNSAMVRAADSDYRMEFESEPVGFIK